MSSFLHALFDPTLERTGGFIEVRAIEDQKGGKALCQEFFTSVEELEHSLPDLRELQRPNGHYPAGIYFGVNPRKERRGDKASVSSVTALYVDIDFPDSGRGPAEALGLIQSFPIPPSAIVQSGHGFHVYWFLLEPEKDLARAEAVMRGFANHLDGDHCWNVDRLLRLPGTMNYKCYEETGGPVLCKIRELHPDRRYTLGDFDNFAVEDSAPASVVSLRNIPEQLPQKFLELLEVKGNTRLRGAWEGQRNPPHDQSRSGYDQMMANVCIWYGLTKEETASVLRHYKFGRGPEGSLDYLQMTIGKAISSVPALEDHAAVDETSTNVDAGTIEQTQRRSRINAVDHDLERVSNQAWKALLAGNNPPVVYRFGGLPARVERDDDGIPHVAPLNPDRLRYRLAQVAEWYRFNRKGTEISAYPPLTVVRNMLARPEPPLPPLTRIVHCPTLAPSGELLIEPGYQVATGVFFHAVDGTEIPSVSAQPCEKESTDARELLFEPLEDFPFVGDAERAHALALELLPFVRDMIAGPTPLHLIEKPTPGTGASLLAEVLAFPATGIVCPVMTEGKDEDSWRKRLTSKLVEGPTYILIDNLRARLESAALSSAITAKVWEDRILGSTQMARVKVRCGWLATANNPALSNEIARRTVRIRLDAKVYRPWLREGFRYPDLRSWVAENRGRLIWAALTLVQAWIQKGRPYSGQKLGMFEDWSQVMGGILEVSGIPGFLGNLEELYDQADQESGSWSAFVCAWWESYGDKEVGVAELWKLVDPDEVESSPIDLGLPEGDPRAQKISLGKKLMERRDRQFGQLRIVMGGKRKHAQLWKLTRAQGGAR